MFRFWIVLDMNALHVVHVPVTYSVNDFIEVEEESDVSLSTSDEPKPISQSCYHSLQRAVAREVGTTYIRKYI